MSSRLFVAIYCFAVLPFTGNCFAAQADRITQPVKSDQVRAVRGNIPRLARPQYDQGPADAALQMDHVLLLFKPSQAQQADLDQLLAAQRNPSSPEYHNWLTPEAYASRFGLSTSDHSKVVAWLHSQGLTVQESGRGRNWVAFSGNTSQISTALHTSIRRYFVNGESHIANSAEPSVPAAIADVVSGFIGLDDFHLRPMMTKQVKIGAAPNFNAAANKHYLAPEDFSTIYDLSPLYKNGFDGSGQSIAIVGQSAIAGADISAFRSRFGLPVNAPHLLLYGTDPGTNGAEIEGDLDLEWAGAIAPRATLYYIFGQDALVAAAFAVNLNLAQVLSISYGNCEIEYPALLFRTIFQQGNAQGITTLAASGDSGAAGCDAQGLDPFATRGEAATFPSNLPEVTGVGGTQFDDGSGTFWSSGNDTSSGSALSYIPELAWNETAPGFGLGSSGGGASTLIAKPDWQTGAGVPDDGARDIPDIAMAAAVHNAYLVVNQNTLFAVGGTSAASPSLAGILAMLNQYQVSKGFQTKAGLGNINPQLYRLALAAAGVFHDINSGDNVVPCAQGTPDCLNRSYGFTTGQGYDLVTGLGSIDANNLVTLWHTVSQPVQMTITASPTKVTENDRIQLSISVVDPSGVGVPTGVVNFQIGGVALGSATLSSDGTATFSFDAAAIGAGSGAVIATYSGDANYSGGSASVRIQITIPAGAAAVLISANPNPVHASPPDAQGSSWQVVFNLHETAGVGTTITSFSIDGDAQSLAQYFPSTSLAGNGTMQVNVVFRNLAYPATKNFTFTGIDSSGNTWTRAVPVTFLGPQVFQNFSLSATPLIMHRNPAAEASCQYSQLLTLDETGGFTYQIVSLAVGNVFIDEQIPSIFGTNRLAPYGSLQGTLCWSGIAAPATNNILIVLADEFGNLLETELTVSFADAVAAPAKITTSVSSLTLQQPSPALSPQASFSLEISDKTQPWTISVSPGNRTTAWLTLSQYSGTGSTQITATGSGAGFEPGAYRALITIQSLNATPATVTIPVMFVLGPADTGAGATSIMWAANALSFKSTFSPGEIVAVGGTQLSNSVQQPLTLPLPFVADGASATVNGIAAPLYYSSPTQLNIQVPYEVGSGPAVLGVFNHGQVAGYQLQVAATAPAIVTDANGSVLPSSTATAGSIATMYITGYGDVTPALQSGSAPAKGTAIANLPHPRQPVTVTIGGEQAFLQFVGVTPGVVGVMQVNFAIPASVPEGAQAVVATIGGVSSSPASVLIQTAP